MPRHQRNPLRAITRHTRISLPGLLLALGCGERYELGALNSQQSNLAGPPQDVTLAGVPLLDSTADADAQIAPIPDPGAQPQEAFIEALIAAGDMDGDGYEDVVIQHLLFNSTPLGYALRIVYGGPRPSDGVIPIEAGASFGLELPHQREFRVTPAGDVNGDGLADLFITTGVTYLTWPPAGFVNEYGADPGPAAYLLYGSAERPNAQGVAPLSEVAVAFGDRDDIGRDVVDEIFYKTVSLSALGDTDGDGFDDFALTTNVLAEPFPEHSDRTGLDPLPRGSATYLFYGQSEPFSSDAALQRPAAKLAGMLTAEPLGDVDGDGFADAIFAGDVPRILPGAATRRSGDVPAATAVPFEGLPPYLASQESPARIGDLDLDGYADFVLRGDRIEGEGTDVHGRYSYLVYGGSGLLDRERLSTTDADAVFDPRASGWLVPVGDWDADGNADLLVFHYTWVEGQLYSEIADDELLLLRGSSSRFSGVLEAPLLGDEVSGVGLELSSPTRLGDLDGDGFADLSVTANGPTGRSRAFVKYGRPVSLPPIR